jgi:SAM-dependent methyltransferase
MIAFAERLSRGSLDEVSFHFAPQFVVFAGVKLGVFSEISEGAKDAAAVASATGCSPRGMRMLLDCMAALGLLQKRGGRYGLNRISRKYFLPASEDYVGQIFLLSDVLVKLWSALPEAVKTGKPALSKLIEGEKERLQIELVDALFQVHRADAWRLAEALEKKGRYDGGFAEPGRILDLAAGSAVWSIPFALKYRRAQVSAVDFAPVLDVTRRYTEIYGIRNRYRFIAGDVQAVDFGTDEFDIVMLGHICHSEGPKKTQRLMRKSYRALRERGKLLIMDYISDEERKSEILPLLLALNTLLGTEEGDTFTFSEYERWLLDAGFKAVRTVRVGRHSPILVALRA